MLLKWSNTRQDRKSILTIPLPSLGQSSLCPIGALTRTIHAFPASKDDPLFVIPRFSHLVPITDSVARKHLKKTSSALNIFPSMTFHAFRQADVSWAFSHRVPLEHIIRHGTWCSDVIWTYLSSTASTISPVSAVFKQPCIYSPTGVWVPFSHKFDNNINIYIKYLNFSFLLVTLGLLHCNFTFLRPREVDSPTPLNSSIYGSQ